MTKIKTFFLFLSFALWLKSNWIADCFFPGVTTEDIDNYWEVKKILYLVCILLAILSTEQKTKWNKFLSLVFIGMLGEDISDRIQGITYFQYSDILVVELIIASSIYIIYKEELKSIYKKCFQH